MTSPTLKGTLDAACERLAASFDARVVDTLDVDRAVAQGVHLRSAAQHIEARDRALADLDGLDALAPDFGVRRFLALTAYWGTCWCVYDLASDFVGRVLLEKDKTKDRTFVVNLVSTFFTPEDGNKKVPGFLPPPVRDVVRENYAGALGASYALRNACLHQGLVVHTRAFDGAFLPSAELRRIAEDGAKRASGTLDAALWADDVRTTLKLLQGRSDALVALLVEMAVGMLETQTKCGVELLKRSTE